MLRMRFMPCDFHPLLLVLGGKDDLDQFSQILLQFAVNGECLELGKEGIFSEDTSVKLVEVGTDNTSVAGLWKSNDTGSNLVWTLTREQAAGFGQEVSKIVSGISLAGSATLECEILNEIRVKVSLGEFEDEFLVGSAC